MIGGEGEIVCYSTGVEVSMQSWLRLFDLALKWSLAFGSEFRTECHGSYCANEHGPHFNLGY